MLGFIVAFLFAQKSLAIDGYVRLEMARTHVPGVAVAVVKNGHVVFAKGYGLANVELDVAVTPQTIFQGGSIGKQFTATAVMQLVESGKIALDDKIAKYLGDVPPSWKDLTIRHLLTHTSGIAPYPDGFDERRDYTEDELLKIIESQPLAFVPGTKWEYSNTGYVTLGILIHRVTGQFYGDVITEKIFKPAGMTTARVISETAIVPNRAAGYVYRDGRLLNQSWVSPTLNRTADGSLYFTIMDLARWDAALYGETILHRATLDQMWTAARLADGTATSYGFGWFIMNANGHRLIEHEGAWQGFNANISRYVDDKLTVIVMSNLKSARTQMMSHRIAGLFLPAVAPPEYKPIADRNPEVTKLVKDTMRAVASGVADPKVFPPEKAKLYQSYLEPLGDPVSVTLVEHEGRVYRYEFAYRKVTLLVSVTLDAKGRIASLDAADNY